MAYSGLTLTFDRKIALLQLRAEHITGISDELVRACDDIAARDDVSAVLLVAPPGSLDGPDLSAQAVRRLEMLPQPVIACIEGAAVAGGLELALACDMRIAGEGASFALPQVTNGTMPASGGTQRLPRLIGRSRATEMILVGVTLDARSALACGLVNAVVADGAAGAEGRKLADRVAAQGPLAVRYAKEALLRGLDMPLDQALRYETDLTVILQTTADRAEGVRAFTEKRAPRFGGR